MELNHTICILVSNWWKLGIRAGVFCPHSWARLIYPTVLHNFFQSLESLKTPNFYFFKTRCPLESAFQSTQCKFEIYFHGCIPVYKLYVILIKICEFLLKKILGWVGLWGFLWWAPSAKRKDHHGWALDGAVFDIAQILAYLVHNMSRSQLYLGFGHFGWLPSFFGQ